MPPYQYVCIPVGKSLQMIICAVTRDLQIFSTNILIRLLERVEVLASLQFPLYLSILAVNRSCLWRSKQY